MIKICKIFLFNLFIFFNFMSSCLSQQIVNSVEKDEPIEIFAEGGIEWDKNKKIYTAKKNAEAKKGELIVNADILEAHYDEKKENNNEIKFLKAIGNVKINDGKTFITGGRNALYDIKKEHFIIFGNNVKMTSQNDILRANMKLEFWQKKNIAIATGNAEALRKQKYKINAEKLVTHLITNEIGESDIKKIIAYNKVIIKTNNEIAYGDKALYNKSSEICKLFGNVKLRKDENFLTGEYAEMNLNDGISKLLPYPGNRSFETESRVKALIKKQDD